MISGLAMQAQTSASPDVASLPCGEQLVAAVLPLQPLVPAGSVFIRQVAFAWTTVTLIALLREPVKNVLADFVP